MNVISTKKVQIGVTGIKVDKFSTDGLLFLRNAGADRWIPEVKTKSGI